MNIQSCAREIEAEIAQDTVTPHELAGPLPDSCSKKTSQVHPVSPIPVIHI